MFTWGAVPVDSVRSSITDMMRQYPESSLLDIYKSSFQNLYGPGHIVSDTAKAKAYLDWELQQPFKHENPLYEPTIPDGKFYRVNLSVITDSIVPYGLYFDSFLESVRDIDMPPVDEWAKDWSVILEIIESMDLSLADYEADREAIDGRLAQGIYQGEHSRRYVEAYDPHYRIIRRDIFENRIKPLIDLYINSSFDNKDAYTQDGPQ